MVIMMIVIIAGHATPAIGLQLCGRGGDGGQVERKILGLMISRSFSPYFFAGGKMGIE